MTFRKKCEQCDEYPIHNYFKLENIYVNDKWIAKKTMIFLCSKHFAYKKQINHFKIRVQKRNQKIINHLSLISDIKIKNNYGHDMIDEEDLMLLINGIKYIKQCN